MRWGDGALSAFGFAASLYSILESGLCCGQSGTVLSSCTEEHTEHLLVKLTVIGCCNLLLQERCRSRTCSPASHRALNGWGPGVRTVLNMQHAFAKLLWKVAWLPPAERGALGGHESLWQTQRHPKRTKYRETLTKRTNYSNTNRLEACLETMRASSCKQQASEDHGWRRSEQEVRQQSMLLSMEFSVDSRFEQH